MSLGQGLRGRVREGIKAGFIRMLRKTREGRLVQLVDRGLLSVCPVIRLVNHQYRENQFDRYDLAVRWLAIEDYFGKNDYGFRLYNKMQIARSSRVGSESRFRSLIESVHRDGIDYRSAITIALDGRITSGAHRITLAMYFGVNALQVQVTNARTAKPYGLDWFRSQGFTPDELEQIVATRSRMFHWVGLFYHAIVWPPASRFCEKIARDISTAYPVEKICTIELPHAQFAELLQEIHRFDELAPGQVAKATRSVPAQASHVTIITFEIPSPAFRMSSIDPDLQISAIAEDLAGRYQTGSEERADSEDPEPVCFVSGNYCQNRRISEFIAVSESHVDGSSIRGCRVREDTPDTLDWN